MPHPANTTQTSTPQHEAEQQPPSVIGKNTAPSGRILLDALQRANRSFFAFHVLSTTLLSRCLGFSLMMLNQGKKKNQPQTSSSHHDTNNGDGDADAPMRTTTTKEIQHSFSRPQDVVYASVLGYPVRVSDVAASSALFLEHPDFDSTVKFLVERQVADRRHGVSVEQAGSFDFDREVKEGVTLLKAIFSFLTTGMRETMGLPDTWSEQLVDMARARLFRAVAALLVARLFSPHDQQEGEQEKQVANTADGDDDDDDNDNTFFGDIMKRYDNVVYALKFPEEIRVYCDECKRMIHFNVKDRVYNNNNDNHSNNSVNASRFLFTTDGSGHNNNRGGSGGAAAAGKTTSGRQKVDSGTFGVMMTSQDSLLEGAPPPSSLNNTTTTTTNNNSTTTMSCPEGCLPFPEAEAHFLRTTQEGLLHDALNNYAIDDRIPPVQSFLEDANVVLTSAASPPRSAALGFSTTRFSGLAALHAFLECFVAAASSASAGSSSSFVYSSSSSPHQLETNTSMPFSPATPAPTTTSSTARERATTTTSRRSPTRNSNSNNSKAASTTNAMDQVHNKALWLMCESVSDSSGMIHTILPTTSTRSETGASAGTPPPAYLALLVKLLTHPSSAEREHIASVRITRHHHHQQLHKNQHDEYHHRKKQRPQQQNKGGEESELLVAVDDEEEQAGGDESDPSASTTLLSSSPPPLQHHHECWGLEITWCGKKSLNNKSTSNKNNANINFDTIINNCRRSMSLRVLVQRCIDHLTISSRELHSFCRRNFPDEQSRISALVEGCGFPMPKMTAREAVSVGVSSVEKLRRLEGGGGGASSSSSSSHLKIKQYWTEASPVRLRMTEEVRLLCDETTSTSSSSAPQLQRGSQQFLVAFFSDSLSKVITAATTTATDKKMKQQHPPPGTATSQPPSAEQVLFAQSDDDEDGSSSDDGDDSSMSTATPSDSDHDNTSSSNTSSAWSSSDDEDDEDDSSSPSTAFDTFSKLLAQCNRVETLKEFGSTKSSSSNTAKATMKAMKMMLMTMMPKNKRGSSSSSSSSKSAKTTTTTQFEQVFLLDPLIASFSSRLSTDNNNNNSSDKAKEKKKKKKKKTLIGEEILLSLLQAMPVDVASSIIDLYCQSTTSCGSSLVFPIDDGIVDNHDDDATFININSSGDAPSPAGGGGSPASPRRGRKMMCAAAAASSSSALIGFGSSCAIDPFVVMASSSSSPSPTRTRVNRQQQHRPPPPPPSSVGNVATNYDDDGDDDDQQQQHASSSCIFSSKILSSNINIIVPTTGGVAAASAIGSRSMIAASPEAAALHSSMNNHNSMIMMSGSATVIRMPESFRSSSKFLTYNDENDDDNASTHNRRRRQHEQEEEEETQQQQNHQQHTKSPRLSERAEFFFETGCANAFHRLSAWALLVKALTALTPSSPASAADSSDAAAASSSASNNHHNNNNLKTANTKQKHHNRHNNFSSVVVVPAEIREHAVQLADTILSLLPEWASISLHLLEHFQRSKRTKQDALNNLSAGGIIDTAFVPRTPVDRLAASSSNIAPLVSCLCLSSCELPSQGGGLPQCAPTERILKLLLDLIPQIDASWVRIHGRPRGHGVATTTTTTSSSSSSATTTTTTATVLRRLMMLSSGCGLSSSSMKKKEAGGETTAADHHDNDDDTVESMMSWPLFCHTASKMKSSLGARIAFACLGLMGISNSSRVDPVLQLRVLTKHTANMMKSYQS